MDFEIEKLADVIEEQERHIKEANYEIERLNNIIKEVREYIENTPLQKGTEYYRIQLLQILDKGDSSNE